MRDAQVRRVPVVNDMGRLVAAISIGDLVLVAQNVGAGADAASVVGFHAVGRVGRRGRGIRQPVQVPRRGRSSVCGGPGRQRSAACGDEPRAVAVALAAGRAHPAAQFPERPGLPRRQRPAPRAERARLRLRRPRLGRLPPDPRKRAGTSARARRARPSCTSTFGSGARPATSRVTRCGARRDGRSWSG